MEGAKLTSDVLRATKLLANLADAYVTYAVALPQWLCKWDMYSDANVNL